MAVDMCSFYLNFIPWNGRRSLPLSILQPHQAYLRILRFFKRSWVLHLLQWGLCVTPQLVHLLSDDIRCLFGWAFGENLKIPFHVSTSVIWFWIISDSMLEWASIKSWTPIDVRCWNPATVHTPLPHCPRQIADCCKVRVTGCKVPP